MSSPQTILCSLAITSYSLSFFLNPLLCSLNSYFFFFFALLIITDRTIIAAVKRGEIGENATVRKEISIIEYLQNSKNVITGIVIIRVISLTRDLF